MAVTCGAANNANIRNADGKNMGPNASTKAFSRNAFVVIHKSMGRPSFRQGLPESRLHGRI